MYLDFLTGCLNRNAYELFFDSDIHLLLNSETSFSLILIDIDKLKMVNDTYGHFVGDHYLMAFTSSVDKCLQSPYCIYRIGGDEYVVIKINDHKVISARVEKILNTFANDVKLLEKSINGSFSYGIVNSDELLTIGTVNALKLADFRMMDMKKAKNMREEEQ